MLQDLKGSGELAWRLLVRDLSAQYRQTLLGYLWAFLPPLVTTATWVFLNQQAVVQISSPAIPYPLYVMIGSLLWQGFLDALNSPLKALVNAKPMLVKISFPREALILAGLGEVIVNFLIRLVLLVPLVSWYRFDVPATALVAVLGVAALMAFGLVLGLLLAPVAILYGDVQRLLAVVTTFWFFLTPVIYPPPAEGLARLVVTWNPVAPLLVATRDWLTLGSTGELLGFFVVASLTAGAMIAGWLFYRLAMPHVVARIGA